MADVGGGSALTPEELDAQRQAALAAMQRATGAALPPVRIGADSTAPGGEDPLHQSTNVEGTLGGLNPTGGSSSAPQVSPNTGVGPDMAAIQRAAATASATAGGPPPGFTGTFNGKAYSGGQLLSSEASSAPVNPTTVASSGSILPPKSPTITTGGSLGSSLVPPQPISTTTTTPPNKPGFSTNEPGAPPATAELPATGTTPGAGTTDLGTGANGSGGQGGQGGQGGSGDLGALTSGIMQQLQGIQQSLANPGTPVDAQAVYLKQASSILDMLNQQEAQLKADNAKQGTEIDPATQFTIDKLRQNLEDNLKTTRENLNSRGLYDSGIELQLESNLQKGNASDQAQILADRLSKLQDQLNTGLSSIRSQKVSTASQFGLAGANAQNSQNELSQNLQKDREASALQAMLNLRGQVNSAETARLGQVGDTARADASNTAAMQRALLAEQGAGQRNQYTTDAENARAAATLGQNQNEFNNLSAMQRATLANEAANRATTASNPYTSTNQMANTQSAINDMRNTFSSQEEAMAAINSQAASLAQTIGPGGLAALQAAAQSLPHRTGGALSRAAGAGGSGDSRLQ